MVVFKYLLYALSIIFSLWIFHFMKPIRTANYTRADRAAVGHETQVQYIASIAL